MTYQVAKSVTKNLLLKLLVVRTKPIQIKEKSYNYFILTIVKIQDYPKNYISGLE